MADNDTWLNQFRNLMTYLYEVRGWRVPFMMRRHFLVPVGIAGIKRKPLNDNRRQPLTLIRSEP